MIEFNNSSPKKFDKGILKGCVLSFFMAFTILICSCSTHDDTRLTYIESVVESDPAEALSVLESIDPVSLKGARNQAEYSLLWTMAKSKVSSLPSGFTELQPAIDFFLKHGSATDKLRTLYYQGRIYAKNGEDELAMKCYAEALDYLPDNQDLYCLSRIYGSQAAIYKKLFNYDKCIESAKKAAQIMKEIGDTTNYFLELNTITNSLLYLDRGEEALVYLSECDSLWQGRRYASQRDYFRNHILYAQKYGDSGQVSEWVERYLEAIPKENVYWPFIADVYYKEGELEKAESAMLNHARYDGTVSAGTEATNAQIMEAKGEYREALSHYKQYIHLSDSADLYAYRHDTRAVPELHELDMELERQQHVRQNLLFALIAILAILTLAVISFRQRTRIHQLEAERMRSEVSKAKEDLERQRLEYDSLQEEYERLKEIAVSLPDKNLAISGLLEARVELLNKLFLANIREDWEETNRINSEINTLVNERESFVSSLYEAFKLTSPYFVDYLEGKGLDEREVRCCCLYAIGLRGGEVGHYMQDARHYHMSSAIRTKLGLGPRDTNLSVFLRNLAQKD